ncbi:MAG: site-specific DNA-methyltransferase [Bacteroidaceae bacterium]
MDRLNMQTTNIVDENIKRIGAMFPNCLTERLNEEGKPEMAIDFDQLRQELSKDIVDGLEERYQFTWPDKRNAIRLANAPTTDTLRPCREESVDFDNTQNLYIEGDNLQVLKLLRENYLGKVKMIYIDPPYNTGNDFVYNDNFDQDKQEYVHNSGQYDEEGNQLVTNTENNGRFHTDWLNMIYPRLKVAKDLLNENGVIFISIGEDELENLTKITDELFGAANRIGIVPRVMKSGGGKGQFFSPNIDYVVIYGRLLSVKMSFKEPISEEVISKLYTSVETEGERKGERYRPFGLYQSSLDSRPNQRYYIQAPDGTLLIPPGNVMPDEQKDGASVKPVSNEDKVWRWSCERYLQEKEKGNIEFKKSDGVLIDADGKPAKWNVYTKIWLSDRQEEGMTPVNFITKYENRHSAKELKALEIPFDFAKPIGLISYLAQLCSVGSNDIVLDFFSGSATTAHAVMQLNSEDGGKSKFIMVQLPEATDEKSEAYKAGYKNICEIGKERIRRAGKKIKEESPLTTQDLDTGFRVLKLDSSNMQDVYYTPSEFNEQKLFDDNIKPDRTEEDLLFQTMIELGIELSAKIEMQSIAGKTVWSVSDGYLMACFDEDVNETTITEIARQHPYYFVMRDSSLANDQVADNFEQIWEEYSKDTVRRIL